MTHNTVINLTMKSLFNVLNAMFLDASHNREESEHLPQIAQPAQEDPQGPQGKRP